MLEQLKTIKDRKDEHFRNDLLRMLMFMKLTQQMIITLQENSTVTGNPEYKQLRSFAKEVYKKNDWFISVVKKMAGENAAVIESEITFDNDKLNDLANVADFIATSTDKNISDAVDLITNRSRREDLLFTVWKQSRFFISPDINVNREAFQKWLSEEYPQ